MNLNYVINLYSVKFGFFNFTAHYSPCTHQYYWSNSLTCTRGSELWLPTYKLSIIRVVISSENFVALPTKCFGAHWGLAAALGPEHQGHLTAPAREQGRLVGSPGSALQTPPWGQVKARVAHQCHSQEQHHPWQSRSVTDSCRAAPAEELEVNWHWGHGPPQVRLLKATGDYQSQKTKKKFVESKQVSWIKEPPSCSLVQKLKAHKVLTLMPFSKLLWRFWGGKVNKNLFFSLFMCSYLKENSKQITSILHGNYYRRM